METPRAGAGTARTPLPGGGTVRDAGELATAVGGSALEDLLDDLREAIPWDVAYASYRRRSGSGRPMPFPDRRVNFTWLTDLERTGRAVDVGSPFGNLAADLALEFARVDYIGGGGTHGRIVAERLAARDGRVRAALASEEHAMIPEAAADLVAFVASEGWQERLPPRMRTPEEVVRACSRLVRRGGWVALMAPNPLHRRLWREGDDAVRAVARSSAVLAAFRSHLRTNGSSEIREYLVAPDLDVPTAFVPATRTAVLAYLRSAALPARTRGLAWAGLHYLLFPGVLLLARR